jgi:hypothetical protein
VIDAALAFEAERLSQHDIARRTARRDEGKGKGESLEHLMFFCIFAEKSLRAAGRGLCIFLHHVGKLFSANSSEF